MIFQPLNLVSIKIIELVILDHFLIILCEIIVFSFLPSSDANFLDHISSSWTVPPLHKLLPLFNLNHFSVIPSEVLVETIIVLHIICVDLSVFKDRLQYKLIVNHRIASHVQVDVGSVTEIKSSVIAWAYLFWLKKACISNLNRASVPRLDDHLVSFRFQIHILDLGSLSEKVHVILFC